MPRQLFIVSRETPYLAAYMQEQFSDEPDVDVVVDRRSGLDRRASCRPVDVDRRASGDRRQRHDVQQALRTSFHVLVPAVSG